ncbi:MULTISPECIES: hypothetical protein [Bacillus cereus group]|uniref:Uncharacterized protein n=1 Tax=Bacillus thuringiensis TaxID=1428 RepID=A0A9X6VC32_BACTU|nr:MULTISPECIES: hypothetical protein [Bacillus cereus group]MEC3272729.1 hypothetical protein [Bacillus thuringiensis]PFB07844.1 hypothetical protein CN398_08885 [Bacillus thuringiensis]
MKLLMFMFKSSLYALGGFFIYYIVSRPFAESANLVYAYPICLVTMIVGSWNELLQAWKETFYKSKSESNVIKIK